MILNSPLSSRCVLGVMLLNESHAFAFGDEIYNWEE